MKNLNGQTIIAAALLLTASAASAQDWPQWRGPNRDNKVVGFRAPSRWPMTLKQQWQTTVGIGVASPALVGNRVYVFARQGDEEATTCMDATTGKIVWQDKYGAVAVRGAAADHPGTRSSPAVAEGKICTLGVAGVLSCLDAATGKVVWRKDTQAWPQFYTAFSPIIVDGHCIAHLGGRGGGALTAFDLNTGAGKWKWTGEGPAYGSPVLMTLGGVKQLATLTERSLIGIAVADGKLLWQVPFASGRYNTGTPVVEGTKVFCSGQAFQIDKQGDAYIVKDLWKSQAPHQYNTPVLKDGVLYGLSNRQNFYAVNAQTGEVLWTDATRRGECGHVLDAGSVMLALTTDSELIAFRPSNKEYSELAKLKVSETLTWAEPIFAGNRVFVKDRNTLTLFTIE